MRYSGTAWQVCHASRYLVIPDLRFADDIALLSDNVSNLQIIVDCIAQTAENLDMCINVSKTEIPYLWHGSKIFRYT